MNKLKERSLIEKFKNLYQMFPDGDITESEQPDFILQTKDKLIGIELTEVFQDFKLQQLSSEKHSFSNELISMIEKYVPFTFSIDIQFDIHNKIRKTDRIHILYQTFDCCINEILQLEN